MYIPDHLAESAATALKSYLKTTDGMFLRYYCMIQYDNIVDFIERVENEEQQRTSGDVQQA